MTIDNSRQYDPSMVIVPQNLHPKHAPILSAAIHNAADSSQPSGSGTNHSGDIDAENQQDIANDPFADYFNPESERDPTIPPKVLITTSPYATAPTWELCEDLVDVFPGAEFHKRAKQGFRARIPPLGTVAQWAVKREYSSLIVVNEDHHKPSTAVDRSFFLSVGVDF